MAREHEELAVDTAAWTQITNGDVTSVQVQVLGGGAELHVTAGAVAPGDDATGIVFRAGDGFSDGIAKLGDISGGNRVWARATSPGGARVRISHA